MKIQKLTLTSFAIALAGLALNAQTVTVMGSTALGPIVKKAAEESGK